MLKGIKLKAKKSSVPAAVKVVKNLVSTLLDKPEQEAGHCHDRKHNEKKLAYADGAGGNAPKTEQGGDQRNDKKYNGVVQHDEAPG